MIRDLKTNPQAYDGEYIKLTTTVSSIISYDEYNEITAVADGNSITGDPDIDYYAFQCIEFDQYSTVFVMAGTDAYYYQDDLSVGDSVVIVGFFYYTAKGEEVFGIVDGEFSTIPSKISSGKIGPRLVYSIR